jgi:hypothetical protein
MASLLEASITPEMAFNEAVRRAEQRSYHTYFDTHVVEEADGSYLTLDEGDYGRLPMQVIDRITYTAQGRMADEY